MIRRISSNGWWLFKDAVEHLLSSLFPVVPFSNKMVEAPWAKYEYQKLDPQRPLEAFESWAGNKHEWSFPIRIVPMGRRRYVVAA